MYDFIYRMQQGLKPLGSPNRTSCSLVRVCQGRHPQTSKEEMVTTISKSKPSLNIKSSCSHYP